jgi:hypothetical protein
MARSRKYSRKGSRKSKTRSHRKSRARKSRARKSRSRKSRSRKSRSRKSRSRKSRSRKSRSRRRRSSRGWDEVKCHVKRSPTNSKQDLIKEIRAYANCWEKATGKNQDMSLERLREEKVSDLKRHLKWYRSQ